MAQEWAYRTVCLSQAECDAGQLTRHQSTRAAAAACSASTSNLRDPAQDGQGPHPVWDALARGWGREAEQRRPTDRRTYRLRRRQTCSDGKRLAQSAVTVPFVPVADSGALTSM